MHLEHIDHYHTHTHTLTFNSNSRDGTVRELHSHVMGGAEDFSLRDNRGANLTLGGAGRGRRDRWGNWCGSFRGTLVQALKVQSPILSYGKVPKSQR